jgi:histone H3/H4
MYKEGQKMNPDQYEVRNPSIMRMARLVNIKRVGGTLYEEARVVIRNYLVHKLKRILIRVEMEGRKTVTDSDVAGHSGVMIPGGVQRVQTYDTHADRGRDDAPRVRRSKPGARAKRETAYLQSHDAPSTCYVPPAAFARLIRQVAKNNLSQSEIRFQPGALLRLQHGAERRLILLLGHANKITLYCKRETVTGADLVLAALIRLGDDKIYSV